MLFRSILPELPMPPMALREIEKLIPKRVRRDVQVGLSLKSHDPSQRANGFLTLAGGVIITFAKEILDLIMA